MGKIKIKNVALTIILVSLLILIIIMASSENVETPSNETGQNNTNFTPISTEDNTTELQPGEEEDKTIDLSQIKPVKYTVTALLGEPTVIVLDFSHLPSLDSQKINLKYDPNLARVELKTKSNKFLLTITPFKDEDFTINIYYESKLISFVSVNVIAHKLVSVSEGYTIEVEPYTSISKTFTFTVKNEYNVSYTVTTKAFSTSDLKVEVIPEKITLNPGESGIIKVIVTGVIEENPAYITLSIDGVQRIIKINTHPIDLKVTLLDNTVIAGRTNNLIFNIHSNSNLRMNLYINDKYFDEVYIQKGDNQITIPYTVPTGECYISLVSKYGSLKLTLKNPYGEYIFYFDLKILTDNQIPITVDKTELSFYEGTPDSTIIIFKNQNNYDVALTPIFQICENPNDLNTCHPPENFKISFYEVNGEEINTVTLKPFQTKLYRLIIKPIKLYHEDFEKYLLITFNGTKIINNQSLPLQIDTGIILKMVNKVDKVQANFDITFNYNEEEGGYIKVIITTPTEYPLKNTTLTYWVKGFNGEHFQTVRDKLSLTLNEFGNKHTLMISLPSNYKFFIFYIEVKGEKIEGSTLEYLYP